MHADSRARAAVLSELEDKLKELKKQLDRNVINKLKYEQKRTKLLEELTELERQLFVCIISRVKYEQEKKKLLEKHQAR